MAALSLLATIGLLAVPGANAQGTAPDTTTTAPAPAKDQAVQMEKFQVTGSYLTPAANSVAIPVITVDSKAIANSGEATNILEILRKTVPQFSGNSNIGSNNANISSGFTNGGSQLSLRNTSTLVLINGRRAAYSGAHTATDARRRAAAWDRAADWRNAAYCRTCCAGRQEAQLVALGLSRMRRAGVAVRPRRGRLDDALQDRRQESTSRPA